MLDLSISLIIFPFSLVWLALLLLLLLLFPSLLMRMPFFLHPSSATPHRKKFLVKLNEVNTGKMLKNKRNKAVEEDKDNEKGEGLVMKTLVMGGLGEEGSGEAGLAPSRARHGKPQLGYLQY